MTKKDITGDWVDRYVRDELSAEDELAFEEQLLEDPALQQQVEAALGIKEALKLDELDEDNQDSTTVDGPLQPKASGNSWTPLAFAASVLLAVASTTLLWRANIESDGLRQQLNEMQQPRTNMLKISVDIMRSAGNGTPDIIIQKPALRGIIALDIELSSRFSQLDEITFQLSEENGNSFVTWAGRPSSDGRASVILNSESIPAGKVVLTMTSPDEQSKETRLMEFRAAN